MASVHDNLKKTIFRFPLVVDNLSNDFVSISVTIYLSFPLFPAPGTAANSSNAHGCRYFRLTRSYHRVEIVVSHQFILRKKPLLSFCG